MVVVPDPALNVPPFMRRVPIVVLAAEAVNVPLGKFNVVMVYEPAPSGLKVVAGVTVALPAVNVKGVETKLKSSALSVTKLIDAEKLAVRARFPLPVSVQSLKLEMIPNVLVIVCVEDEEKATSAYSVA